MLESVGVSVDEVDISDVPTVSTISVHTSGIVTDSSRNSRLTQYGIETLKDRYVIDDTETPQDVFARVSSAYSAGDRALAQRIYDYMSKCWFMPATPVLTNGGANRGLPISCFLNEADDSLKGIVNLWDENVWLASRGGGIGSYWGNLRSIGEKVGRVGTTSGVIPFIRVMDSLTLAISQGNLRRGSAAVYLPVWHPEIEEFVELRRPTGGDPNRKALNLHHGVLVPDAFMEAVEKDLEWELKSPKTGETLRTISARGLWIRILTARIEQGEPYIIYSDTVNRAQPKCHKLNGLSVKTSNLCVHGNTRILTDKGYLPIETLAGTDQTVWNGKEWTLARVEKTSDNAKMRLIEFSNGAKLYVTDHHKFYIQKEYHHTTPTEVRAADLKTGDTISKCQFPVVRETVDTTPIGDAYASGFMTADGTYYPKGFLLPKFIVPQNASLEDRLNWLAGYLDGDGSVTRNGDTETLQFCSTNQAFLGEVRLLLNTLGVDCTMTLMREEREQLLPDGHGGYTTFTCRAIYRCCISAGDTQRLLELGLKTHRLSISVRKVQRDARRFVTVVSNGDDFIEGPTYCANEPKEHKLVFEGVQTGNCAEITLPTGIDHHGKKRTAVCCLSSLNLELYDEWKDNDQFITDVMTFLDNVLQDFIDKAPPEMAQAAYSASRERSVGLGVMGFHSYLQSKHIPYDSVMAKVHNKRIFEKLQKQTLAASVELAHKRGPCPDNAEHGIMERFANRMAIAPTASISTICMGTSPGIEPISANVFLHKTLSGSVAVRNRHLDQLLTEKGQNTPKVWSSITLNKGSVRHLDFLSENEKDVFKTAIELNQRWIIELAADRAPHICQAQSVNVFLPGNVLKRDLHLLHYEAWKKGLKSLYYCRSLSIKRADTVSDVAGQLNTTETTDMTSLYGDTYDECLSCQ